MAKKDELTPQQERFAQAVASGSTLSDAYRAAYKTGKMTDKTINECASELAAHPKVSPRVAELKALIAEKAMLTASDVLKEGMRLATFDVRRLYRPDGSLIPIHELDDDTARCIQGVDIHEEYEGQGRDRVFVGYVKKYKVADKNAALEKLFKHFGLYERDNNQKTSPIEELARAITGQVVKAGTTIKPGTFAQEGDDDE